MAGSWQLGWEQSSTSLQEKKTIVVYQVTMLTVLTLDFATGGKNLRYGQSQTSRFSPQGK